MSAVQQDAGREDALRRIGVVVIGRNEGLRLQRCLDTLPAGLVCVVYVDSGSNDDSVEQARRRGAEVVALDMATPFTAARARNAGFRRLTALHPDVQFVQFVDGDCELLPGWLASASAALAAQSDVAATCGRLRERYPGASVYNRLADLEWDGPEGDVLACGGNAMMRVAALAAAGGFMEQLIGGEEPELCVRLRGQGHRIVRIAADMALHDMAMTRIGQWWRRSLRTGYAMAELARLHPADFRREARALVAWGLLLPTVACGLALVTHGLGLLLLGAYPALWVKVLSGRLSAGRSGFVDAALYASLCVAAKWPGALGVVKRWRDRARNRRGTLIEYK